MLFQIKLKKNWFYFRIEKIPIHIYNRENNIKKGKYPSIQNKIYLEKYKDYKIRPKNI